MWTEPDTPHNPAEVKFKTINVALDTDNQKIKITTSDTLGQEVNYELNASIESCMDFVLFARQKLVSLTRFKLCTSE